MKPVRRKAQMIFQDPYASLDPRMSVGAAIAEPLVIHGIGTPAERRDRVAALLKRVHLSPDHATPLPARVLGRPAPAHLHRPRARAASRRSSSPTKASRRSTSRCEAHVLDLLLELQEEMGLAYLFISHDMAVVERMSHHVAVMRARRDRRAGNPRRRRVREPARPLHAGAHAGGSDSAAASSRGTSGADTDRRRLNGSSSS